MAREESHADPTSGAISRDATIVAASTILLRFFPPRPRGFCLRYT